MDYFLREFGKKIRYYRELKGYSQEKLGELVSVAPNTIGLWERGKSFIEYPTLLKLCDALDIEPAQLFNFPPENGVSYQKQTLDISNLSKPQIDILLKLISEFRK